MGFLWLIALVILAVIIIGWVIKVVLWLVGLIVLLLVFGAVLRLWRVSSRRP